MQAQKARARNHHPEVRAKQASKDDGTQVDRAGGRCAAARVLDLARRARELPVRSRSELLAELLMSDADLAFTFLSDVTGVDRFPIEPRFELNYHLVSIPRRARLRLRTSVSAQQPIIDSLCPVWPGANWLEREIFDLFGIQFEGHPDLRRILLPEGFEGFPLRRDFPVEGKR